MQKMFNEDRGLLVSMKDYRDVMDGDSESFIRHKIDGNGKQSFLDTGLFDETMAMQDNIIDAYIPANKLYVGIATDAMGEIGVPALYVENRAYKFTNTAFSQICEKSGMGVTAYMKKCLANGLAPLVPMNINTWLQSQGDRMLLVRFYEDKVIAFLSSKYGIFDHGDAITALYGALDSDRYQIESHSIGLDNMYIRLIDTEQIILPDASLGRDKSTVGLIFRNGQTGKSLASIEFLVYTFACTNGLVVAQDRGMVYKKRHISIDRTDFTQQIAATLEQFPEYAAAAKINLEKARQARLSMDLQIKLRQQIRKDLAIGEGTVDEIFDMMHGQWDSNAWGMAGAITEVAQKFTAERQYQFERYAGELMNRLIA